VHNPELIPFNLAIKIAGTREGTPFPVFLETLFMEIAIEILREASVRLPGPFGQTIGIVGGFILGDTAVRAGLISPIMTIIGFNGDLFIYGAQFWGGHYHADPAFPPDVDRADWRAVRSLARHHSAVDQYGRDPFVRGSFPLPRGALEPLRPEGFLVCGAALDND